LPLFQDHIITYQGEERKEDGYTRENKQNSKSLFNYLNILPDNNGWIEFSEGTLETLYAFANRFTPTRNMNKQTMIDALPRHKKKMKERKRKTVKAEDIF
jgi:hypothetical protein